MIIMNRLSNSVMILLLGLLLFREEVCASEFAENLYNTTYQKSGTIEWTDLREPFCDFTSPVGYLNTNHELNTFNVELPSQKTKCRADILTCTYQRYGGKYKFVQRHRYSQGPNGKYYEMLPSPNVTGWYVIYERVWAPDEEHEEAFYKHWNGIKTEVKWVSSEDGFCKHRAPDTSTFISSGVYRKFIILLSKRGVIIKAEALSCRYRTSADDTVIISYTETPNAYYEIREYKYEKDVPKPVFAIFRTANSAPPPRS